MAKFVYRDAFVLLNSVNVSDHISKVEVDTKWTVEDGTTMTTTGGTSPLAGLRDESVKITFKQDMAAASIDATLWPIYIGGVSVPIEVRPTSGARSTSNPAWTGNALLTDYIPVQADVGKVATADVVLDIDGILTRQTS